MKPNFRFALLLLVALSGAFATTSCSSISPARALNNETSRLQQQRAGYEDREDAKQQKKDEEYAFQEELRRKSR